MWLEELAWLWVPILGGVGIWMLWQLIVLRTEVRLLRNRGRRARVDRQDAGAEPHVLRLLRVGPQHGQRVTPGGVRREDRVVAESFGKADPFERVLKRSPHRNEGPERQGVAAYRRCRGRHSVPRSAHCSSAYCWLLPRWEHQSPPSATPASS